MGVNLKTVEQADLNASPQPTPEKGMAIRVTIVGGDRFYNGRQFVGKVARVFPAGEEIPEHLMRRYYQPKAGSKFDLNPRLFTHAARRDRVVLQVGYRHYVIYPHQRHYKYEVIDAQEVRREHTGIRKQKPRRN